MNALAPLISFAATVRPDEAVHQLNTKVVPVVIYGLMGLMAYYVFEHELFKMLKKRKRAKSRRQRRQR